MYEITKSIKNKAGDSVEDVKEQILKVISNTQTCYLATTARGYVDNSRVAYCSDEFTIYFGSFRDTLKCRNIEINPYAAVCVDNVQIHVKAKCLKYGSEEYAMAKQRYIDKFPHYAFYFELENNEIYKCDPLAAWYYNSTKGTMHRDMVVFDKQYTELLLPYVAPENFIKRDALTSVC